MMCGCLPYVPFLGLNLFNKGLVRIRLDQLLKAEGQAGVLVIAILGPCRQKVARG